MLKTSIYEHILKYAVKTSLYFCPFPKQSRNQYILQYVAIDFCKTVKELIYTSICYDGLSLQFLYINYPLNYFTKFKM